MIFAPFAAVVVGDDDGSDEAAVIVEETPGVPPLSFKPGISEPDGFALTFALAVTTAAAAGDAKAKAGVDDEEGTEAGVEVLEAEAPESPSVASSSICAHALLCRAWINLCCASFSLNAASALVRSTLALASFFLVSCSCFLRLFSSSILSLSLRASASARSSSSFVLRSLFQRFVQRAVMALLAMRTFSSKPCVSMWPMTVFIC